MFSKQPNFFLVLVSAFLLMVFIGGCSEEQAETIQKTAETVTDSVAAKVQKAGYNIGSDLNGLACEAVVNASIGGGEASSKPGVAGNERWGMPEGAASTLRVRRSWSTLSDADKKQVVDGFLKLKQTTVGSGAPGAERADYDSFCADSTYSYTRNLYDYYVELHQAAFAMMGTEYMDSTRQVHMGPQFPAWHRHYLLRLEADMQQVLGDPSFALPYWDWSDCPSASDVGEDENPCPKLFEEDFLGSYGSCTEDSAAVTGYLVDQGFMTHSWYSANGQTVFNTGAIRCSNKALERQVGCTNLGKNPPSAEDEEAIYDRHVYDAEPYNSCNTDEAVSFRQYVEGYSKSATNPLCMISGCENHGLAHLYVGGNVGDMAGGASPNDPIFFLHHANVDRLWAMWQDNNRANAETAADYGNPEFPDAWRGSIFVFDEIRADEMFDFRALGYQYDTNQPQ